MDHVTSPPPQTQEREAVKSLLALTTLIDVVFKATPSSFPTELRNPNDTFTCSLSQKQHPDAPPSSSPPLFLGELKKHRLRVSLFVVSLAQTPTLTSNGSANNNNNNNNVQEAPPRKNKEHLLGTFAEASFDFDLSSITPPSSFAALSSPPVLSPATPSFSSLDFRRLSILAVLEHRHSASSNGWKEITRKQTPVFGFSRSLVESWPSPFSSSSSLSSTVTSVPVSVNSAPSLSSTSFSASSVPFSSASFLRSNSNSNSNSQPSSTPPAPALAPSQGQQNTQLSERVSEPPGLKVPFFFEVNEAQARNFSVENFRVSCYASVIGAQLAPHAISSTTTFFALAENTSIRVQQGDLLLLTKEGKITNQLKPINQVSLIVVSAQDYPLPTETSPHEGPVLIRVVQSGTCYVNIPTEKYRCSLFQPVLVIYDGEKRKLVASLSERSASGSFGPLASTNVFFLSPGTNSNQIGCLVTPYFFSEEYIVHAAELSQRTISRRTSDHSVPLNLQQSLQSQMQGSKGLPKLSAVAYTSPSSVPSSSSQSYINSSSVSPSVPVPQGTGSPSLSRSKGSKEQNLAPAHQAPQYASRSFQDQKSPSVEYARRSSNVAPATTFLPSSANPPLTPTPTPTLVTSSLVSPFGIPPIGLSSSSSSSSSTTPVGSSTVAPSLGSKLTVSTHGPGSIGSPAFSSPSNGQPTISGPFMATPQSHSNSTTASGASKSHNLSQTMSTHIPTPSRRNAEGGSAQGTTSTPTPKNTSSGAVKKENSHLSSTVPILPSELSQLPSTMDLTQLLSTSYLSPASRRQYGPFKDREHMISCLNELTTEHIFLISLTKSGRHSQEFVASTLDERASNPIFKKLKLMVLSTFKTPHNVELRIIQHNPNHPSRLLLEAGETPASFSVTAQLATGHNSMEASLKPEHPRRVSFPSATFSLELVINEVVVQKWPCQVYNSRYGPRLVQEHPERTPYSRHPAFLVCTPEGTGWKTSEVAVDLPKPSRFTNLQDHVSSHSGKRPRDGRVKGEDKRRLKKKKNKEGNGADEESAKKSTLDALMLVTMPEINQEDKDAKRMTDVGKDGESESEQHIASSKTLHGMSNPRFDEDDENSDDYDELDNEDDDDEDDDEDDEDDFSSSRLEISEHPDAPPSKIPALMSSADPSAAVPPSSQTPSNDTNNKSTKKTPSTPPLTDLTASEGSEAIAALTQLNHSQS